MNTLKNIFFITLPTILIMLLLAELASRLFFPGSMNPKAYYDQEYRIVKFCQDNGQTGRATIGNFAQQRAIWHINNEGWNSPINYYSEKKEGQKRIAVIGDSYIEAFQVDINKSYPYVLNDLLGNEFEVYSFGISGAPLSQYLHIARYVEKKFAPDIYIFTLIHNDFDESINGLYYKPYFLTIKIENDDFIEVQPSEYERAYKQVKFASLLKKSSFLRFLYGNLKLNTIFKIRHADSKQLEMNVIIEDVLNKQDSISSVSAHLFKKFKSELKGKELIFIMDAPRWSIYQGELEKAQITKLNDLAKKLCYELNLPFIDLTPHMLDDYKHNKKRYESDYDGHWNKYGHKFVANVLYEYLTSSKH